MDLLIVVAISALDLVLPSHVEFVPLSLVAFTSVNLIEEIGCKF